MGLRSIPLIAIIAAVLLSGCLKAESDITVNPDDTVDASFTVAVQKAVVAQSGLTDEQIVAQLSATTTAGQTVPYEDDNYIGVTTTVTAMSIQQFSSDLSTAGQIMRIVREGDRYEFFAEFNLDALSGPVNAPGTDPDALAALGQPEISVVMTFPGDVVEANGNISGRTVTWDQTIVGVTALQAVGGAEGAGLPWLPILAVVAGVILLVLLLGLLVWRRRRNRIAPTVGGAAPQQIDPSIPISPYPPVEVRQGAAAPTPYPEGQVQQ